MQVGDRTQAPGSAARPVSRAATRGRRAPRAGALIGGGTDGNERLTTYTGVLLLVLLAVVGVTILRIGQLIWLHLFFGFLVIGPVGVKMASTGYRFVRYYTREPAYRKKGPPELILRLIAPIVVVSTVIVFASGIVLMFDGPRDRGPWLSIHKVSFIVWGVLTAAHVLGHLSSVGQSLRNARPSTAAPGVTPGAAGRWITIAGALVGGVVLAIVLTAQFAPWTAHGAFLHHHHH
ncbi:MAG: hypothetical protein ACR2LV_06040 [Solirubrobacteraceae bacterium]